MKKQVIVALTSATLILVGGGCSSATPATPAAPAAAYVAPSAAPSAAAPAPAPAADFTADVRAKITASGLAFTEKSLMPDVEKMQTKESIADGVKFSFSDGAGSVRAVVVTSKSAIELAGIKTEMDGQYAQITALAPTMKFAWLPGDAKHLVTVYYKAGDEATANKVMALFGGAAGAAAAAPAAAAPVVAAPVTAPVVVAAGFAIGDKVMADWKGGDTWWDAVVTAVNGAKISVKYSSDGSADTLASSAIAHYPTGAAKVKAGDKVVAKWVGSTFYNGTIVSVTATTASVKWSDKSVSVVALTDIAVAGK